MIGEPNEFTTRGTFKYVTKDVTEEKLEVFIKSAFALVEELPEVVTSPSSAP